MVCKECGYIINSKSRFCPSCGMPLQIADEIASTQTKQVLSETQNRANGEPSRRENQILKSSFGEPVDKRQALRVQQRKLEDIPSEEYYDEYDLDDPIENLKTRSRSAYSNVSRNMSKKMGQFSLCGWEMGVTISSAIAAFFFLLSFITSTAGAAMGLIACGLMLFLIRKHPKFDTIEMTLPILAFAMSYGVVGIHSLFTQIGYGSSLLSTLGSIANLFGFGSGLGFTYGSGLIDFAIRILIYTMAILYSLLLIGKIKEVGPVCYYMLIVCGITALYNIVDSFRYLILGFGVSMFHNGSLALSVAIILFTLRAQKPKRSKKKTSNEKWFYKLITVIPSEYSDYDFSEYHPYYTLGGWLMISVVLIYVSAVISSLLGFASIITVFVALLPNGLFGMNLFRITIYVLFYFSYIVLNIILSFKIAKKIRVRDVSFLLLYHVYSIISLSMTFMIQCGQSGMLNAILTLLLSVAGVVIWSVYYCKSVRVRSYFLTDEYLRLSPFTKNVQSPEPEE